MITKGEIRGGEEYLLEKGRREKKVMDRMRRGEN